MRQCDRCSKSHKMGGTRKLLRGHYNPTNWTKKKANLQWSHISTWNEGKRSLLCTKCIKTLARKNPVVIRLRRTTTGK